MSLRPELIVSSLDYDRLDAMLGALPSGHAAGAALAAELARASVVEPGELPADRISMRSTVRFASAHDGAETCATLVYPRQLGSGEGLVSVLAPIGTALLGLKVGDEIDWPLPGGESTRLRVLALEFQPERAGALHA